MPTMLEKNHTQNVPKQNAESYTSVIYEGIYYPEEREDDMGETTTHAKLINKLLAMLLNFFEVSEDIFITSNLNIYREEGNPRKWFAPDLLIAFGVPNVERSSYLLWREEVFPQVIFEIASEKTWRNDIDEKLRLYEELGAEEYYVLDPEFAFLHSPLIAYRREGEYLVELNVENQRILSPRLGLEIVYEPNTFRLFNPQTGEFLLTLEESERSRLENEITAERRRQEDQAEIERLKAEIERLKAEK